MGQWLFRVGARHATGRRPAPGEEAWRLDGPVSLHLLDSDTIIDYLVRRPPAISLLRRLDEQGETLCVCDVVLTEAHSGFSEQARAEAEGFFASLRYLPTGPEAAIQAGMWRYQYRRQGRQLS